MAGLNGREVNVAFARSNTWGTAVAVAKQLNLRSLDNFDAKPGIVTDESFNQDFVGEGQVGDYAPTTPELTMDLRYDGAAPTWLAAACGSASTPAVVSSVAADSLVAYQHVVTLAADLSHFFTLASDFGGAASHYVQEIPTAKPKGFSVRVGDNGKMQITVPLVGAKTVYNSATNTNSVVAAATADPLGNRVFRKQGTFRMKVQGTAGPAAANAQNAREINFGTERPLADADYVFGQDYIIDPDDDGFALFPIEVIFPRMTSQNANSLVVCWPAGTHLQADLDFLGAYINSTTQYEFKVEWPAIQVTEWMAPVTGHGQVRPTLRGQARLAASAATSMGFSQPIRLTFVNMNSANLLA